MQSHLGAILGGKKRVKDNLKMGSREATRDITQKRETRITYYKDY